MIRTRFAPSPTGSLHCGNVRTALFNALLAMREKGQFILRFEDTDVSRSTLDHAHAMQADLHWLGIEWQEGPWYQSERHAIYSDYFRKLEEKQLVYPCFCTDEVLAIHRKLQLSRGEPPRYPGTCKDLSSEEIMARLQQGLKPSWRFRVPKGQTIEFNDLVKGQQRFQTDEVGDFIIRRADGTAPFLFSNALDDALMEVSHVLRGEDHLANTPRQLMILKALSLMPPHYGHMPMILGTEGTPLSKREGSFSVHDLRKKGFLPVAIANYLARLGCTYESSGLMALPELAAGFRPDKLGRSPAHFDEVHLRYWQKLAVMQLTAEELQEWLGPTVPLTAEPELRMLFYRVMQQNILFPDEAAGWAEIVWGGDIPFSDVNRNLLSAAGKPFFEFLEKALDTSSLPSACQAAGKACSLSGKKLFLPVRIALTGRPDGPELAQLGELLGKERLKERVHAVIRDLFSC